MYGKGEIFKIDGSICSIPKEAASICNILARPVVSNGLIVVKLKMELKYRIHVYFEPVCQKMLHQALTYLIKSYDHIAIAGCLSSE